MLNARRTDNFLQESGNDESRTSNITGASSLGSVSKINVLVIWCSIEPKEFATLGGSSRVAGGKLVIE
jgi:hypothetical protein